MWSGAVNEERARDEAADYRKQYFDDLQAVFSRVQHHIHKRGKDGYEPLTACKRKDCKKGTCKHGFPKVKQLNLKRRVICAGNAAKFGLRVSGRRNALGSILGKRTKVWQSGTTPGFAAIFRANTHTQPNHRLPILEKTHDGEKLIYCSGLY